MSLKARVGLGRAVHALLASGDIDAIWVFDPKLGQLARPGGDGRRFCPLPERARDASIKQLAPAISHTRSVLLLGNALSVIAPIKVRTAKGIIGATLVRIPTDRMWQAVRNQIGIAALIALAVLRSQASPSSTLTAEATGGADREARPRPQRQSRNASSIQGRCALGWARPDQIGKALARVFSGMGETVLAREEEARHLVKERTKA